MEKSMFKALIRCALLWFTLLPCGAAADPITLKLAFFSSDRQGSYLEAVKAFLDAVNATGVLHIHVCLSRRLGNSYRGRAQLVLYRWAAIALVEPGPAPHSL